MGAESPGERADAVHHPLDPVPWQAVHIAVVVHRHDLLFEDLVEKLSVAAVGDGVIDVTLPVADGKAIGAVVRLCPPAVEDREVEAAVKHRFLATSAGSLQW